MSVKLFFVELVVARSRAFSCYCLTHLCRVDSSTLTIWIGPFSTDGCLVSFYHCHVV